MTKKTNESKTSFWAKIKEPWSIIPDEKLFFFIWVTFTLIAGQIGTFANMILRDIPITQSIVIDSINGSFYTYVMAIIASSLGLLFINMVESEPNKFKSIKIVCIVISIFLLFFTGIFYSSKLSQYSNKENNFLLSTEWSTNWSEIIIIILSLLMVSYIYCILRLDASKETYSRYKHLDDIPSYAQEDDNSVNNLEEKASKTSETENGIKL